jgi:hypothetical protein
MAQSGCSKTAKECPFPERKQTSQSAGVTSTIDPKRTLGNGFNRVSVFDEASIVIENRKRRYNTARLHSSLG